MHVPTTVNSGQKMEGVHFNKPNITHTDEPTVTTSSEIAPQLESTMSPTLAGQGVLEEDSAPQEEAILGITSGFRYLLFMAF